MGFLSRDVHPYEDVLVPSGTSLVFLVRKSIYSPDQVLPRGAFLTFSGQRPGPLICVRPRQYPRKALQRVVYGGAVGLCNLNDVGSWGPACCVALPRS